MERKEKMLQKEPKAKGSENRERKYAELREIRTVSNLVFHRANRDEYILEHAQAPQNRSKKRENGKRRK